jgi:hypothetical protein
LTPSSGLFLTSISGKLVWNSGKTGVLGQQSGEELTGAIFLFIVSEAVLEDKSQAAQAIQVYFP